MTHRTALPRFSQVGIPVALGMALFGLGCSSRDDIAKRAADGGTSGSSGNGGNVATGGTTSSAGSQGDSGGSGSSSGGGASAGGNGGMGGSTPAGGASGAAPVVGCNESNTIVAPADGRITAFMGDDGILGEMAVRGTPAPTYDIRDGTLHVMVDAPAGTSEILGASYQFESCIDASAFSGVEFSISGSLADCPSPTEPDAVSIGLVVLDSAHVPGNGTGHHTGGPSSIPMHTWLTSAQVTAAPQTVRIPFDVTPTCCQPPTPLDLAKLTGVGWGFSFQGSCVTDITLDDLRFY